MDAGNDVAFGPPEQMFCSEQINIPSKLPELLKNFTKAAIRTQPPDLLAWAASYFAALESGEPLPVNERVELPNVQRTALTEKRLLSLHCQFHERMLVPIERLRERWQHIGADPAILETNLQLGGFVDQVEWLQFLVLGCGSITTDLKEAMNMFCRVYSDDNPGGAARIPIAVFEEVFTWMASQDSNLGSKQVEDIVKYLKEQAAKSNGVIGTRNINHRDCPRFS